LPLSRTTIDQSPDALSVLVRRGPLVAPVWEAELRT
jgi:hypothetical protein